jgi:hypothetical protein
MSRQQVRDWIVGGTQVDSTGNPIATTAKTTTWSTGPTNFTALAPGANINYLAVLVAAAVATSTPQVGRMRLDEIRGRIRITPDSGAIGKNAFSVLIYVSDINIATGLFNVRNGLAPADVSRDDLLYCDAQAVDLATAGNVTAPTYVEFLIDVRLNVLIGGGQALMVSVNADAANATTCQLNTAFRTKAGPIA